MTPPAWPDLDYPAWKDTCAALHLWSQILGKYRVAKTPWINHGWQSALYVSRRGLTTGSVPDDRGAVELTLDLAAHRFTAEGPDGAGGFDLAPMSVAAFFDRAGRAVRQAGGTLQIDGRPNEIEYPVPFAQDDEQRPYDPVAVARYYPALLRIDAVFTRFRSGFIGKASPVHLFWGAFDLAVTRFSGRKAPLHPGGIPNLPDIITREAYSHEVSSAGFWPGGNGVDEAMFYSYAYPVPEGFASAKVAPASVRYDTDLGEFLLSYDTVRRSGDPEGMLMQFLESTYRAAATLADWDREALECATGRPGIPRTVR